MIAPFKYRMGIEFDGRFVAVVLLQPSQRECRLVDTREIDLDSLSGQPDDAYAAGLISAVSTVIPRDEGITAISLVLPVERVIQFTIQLPLCPDLQKDEWEKWEISTHLPGSPEDFLWESSYVRDSLCGKFQIRRVWATRKAFVDRIVSGTSSSNMVLEEIHFPQSIWGKLINRYFSSTGLMDLDCVYVGGDTSYVVRSRQNRITDVMTAVSPGETDSGRFMENMETLMSWHGGAKANADGRLVVDAHGNAETLEVLASKFDFSRVTSDRFYKQLRGTVEKPERYILSLGALGVI